MATAASHDDAVSAPTRIYFDARMAAHISPSNHVEASERVLSIHRRLLSDVLSRRSASVALCSCTQASKEQLCAVHSVDHYDKMANLTRFDTRPGGGDGVIPPSFSSELLDPAAFKALAAAVVPTYYQDGGDMYASAFTFDAARLAAGGVLQATEAVVTGACVNAFAVVRPPGHHCAHADNGFCFFNNVAVAAKHAQRALGVGRIAIVDWDVHHGDGTQALFESDPSVLVLSLHRYGGGFYPGSGAVGEMGTGAGLGFSVNIPWTNATSASGIGDHEYQAAFEYVVLPMLSEFQPELIIVSCGFDAAEGDPLGQLRVTPRMYHNMTSLLCALDPPKGMVMALEGGYNLNSISRSAAAVAHALIDSAPSSRRYAPAVDRDTVARRMTFGGEVTSPSPSVMPRLLPPTIPPPTYVHPVALSTLKAVAEAHAPRWVCMKALVDSQALTVPLPPPLPPSAVLASFAVSASMHWAALTERDVIDTGPETESATTTPERHVTGRWSIPFDSIVLSSSSRRITRTMRSPDGSRRAAGAANARLLKSDLSGTCTLTVHTEAMSSTDATRVGAFLMLRDGMGRQLLRFQVDTTAPPPPSAAATSTAAEALALQMLVPILVEEADGSVRKETVRLFHGLSKAGTSIDDTGRSVTLVHPASMLPCPAEYVIDGNTMDASVDVPGAKKTAVLDVSDTIASMRSARTSEGDGSVTLTSSLQGMHPAVVAHGLTFKTASDVKALKRAIKAAMGSDAASPLKNAKNTHESAAEAAPAASTVAAPAAVTAAPARSAGASGASDNAATATVDVAEGDDDTTYETAAITGGSNLEDAFTFVAQSMRPLPISVSCHAHMMLLKYATKGWTPSLDCAAADAALRRMATDPSLHELKRVRVAHISLPAAIPVWKVRDGAASIDASAPSPSEELLMLTTNNEGVERQIASLTKCMTALIVLGVSDALLAAGVRGPADAVGVLAAPERGLASELQVTARAAAVNRGTKAVINPGERFTVLEMLHGMMLPSGNDAATALAEAYGPYCVPESEDEWRPFERAPYYETQDWQRTDAVSRFVAEMNRTALALGMASTVFANPHGLVHMRHKSCATDVARMIHAAMTDARFRAIVSCRRFTCDAQPPAAITAAPPAAPAPAASLDTGVDALTQALETMAIAAPSPVEVGVAVGASAGEPPAPTIAPAPARKPRPAPLVSRRKAAPTARRVIWTNTNRTLGESRLLRGFSFTGIKTGITAGAFGCLTLHAMSDDPLTPAARSAHAAAADGSRAAAHASDAAHVHLYGVTLGSRSKFHRFLDNTQLLQWCVDALSSVGAFNAPAE